ncbi:C45 family peptidase [Saccharopolyspora sp. NPDC002686]|uniref:C45 family peptidase n=1 Tax=Saccharopolyspora sp. NPDC002686 TaxID=3154541 RepID=UPI003317243A
MGATVVESELGGLRWLVVRGDRESALRALGRAAADEVRSVLGSLPEAAGLREYAASTAGRRAVAEVLKATRTSHAQELREAVALAEGAGVDPEELLLANLRGDLGGDDGVGCSDLAFRGKRSFVAHNEDGAPELAGRFMLVTLAIDGEAPVAVQWYPGFLPCNTFVVTGHGLVWGINHIQVAAPATAAGRHFVARGLQRQPNLEAAVRYLTDHPSAGGFAYNIGELGTGRVVSVETAAGRHAAVETDPGSLSWHTNHLRHVESRKEAAQSGSGGTQGARNLGQREESLARARVLDSLEAPAGGPDTDWFL